MDELNNNPFEPEANRSSFEQPTVDNTACEQSAQNADVPGKSAAKTSMILGIIAVVLCFFGYGSIVSVILGIVGLIFSSKSKKAGFVGSMRAAGFVLSLIGLIGGAITFVACVACVGMFGSLAASGALDELEDAMYYLE